MQFSSLDITAKQYLSLDYGGEVYQCTASDKWWKILHDKKGHMIGEREEIGKPQDFI